MKVRNNIDNFHYLFIWIYYVVCLALSCIVFLLHTNTFFVLFCIVIVLINTLILYFYFGKHYEFNEKYLIIKFGFCKKKIAYKEIKKCYITENSKLSYATSIKRLALKLKNKMIYISPKNMDEALLTIINKKVKEC